MRTAYRVELTARAGRDLRQLYRRIAGYESMQANRWFNLIERKMLSLERHPERGSLVAEDPTCRQLLHGRKPNAYRIIYRIDEAREMVTVLHIRHGARQPMREAFRPAGSG